MLSKDLLFLSFFTFHKWCNAERHIQKNAINNNIGKNFIIRFIKFAPQVKIGVQIHSANAWLENVNFAQSDDCITFQLKYHQLEFHHIDHHHQDVKEQLPYLILEGFWVHTIVFEELLTKLLLEKFQNEGELESENKTKVQAFVHCWCVQ